MSKAKVILGNNIFSEKFRFATHNFMWVSITMPKNEKKLMNGFQENARTDGWIQFHGGPFRLLAEVQ